MKFITSLLALAILTFSSAVIIPEGTPDGLYGGMAGSDKIVLLRNITAEDTEPGAVLRPRGFALSKRLENPRVNCDNYLVDQVFLWYQARDQMFQWCNEEGGALQGDPTWVAFKRGPSVAYICNYTPSRNTCFYEYNQAVDLMDQYCPATRASYVYVERYKKGFGRCFTGHDFCVTGNIA